VGNTTVYVVNLGERVKGDIVMKRTMILVIIGIWLGSTGFAPGSFQNYSKAVKFAKAGQVHFAFMHYNKIIRNFPNSKYRNKALFATGEYYFHNSGMKQATQAFQLFIDENPDAKERLYALAYLLNIANQGGDEAFVQGLEKQIIDLQQVSFVFRSEKEIAYRSPLYQNHKAVIHIDKIEFYVEGKLFAKVSY